MKLMNYFIDFEATQFSGEIISLGCVDENGRQFYSLVRPNRMSEITDFIVSLTGITTEEIAAAPAADKVFNSFLDWLDHGSVARFYCYGDSDAYFLERTMCRLTSFRAQLGLSIIRASLCDYSKDIKQHFSLKHSIALKKVAGYYRGKDVVQTHNSLDDALLLKEVYEKSQSETVDKCPFPEYQKGVELPKVQKRIKAVKGNVKLEFSSFGKAADWVMSENLGMQDTVTEKTKSKVCSRIVTAAEREKPYCGFMWSVFNGAGKR